MWVPHTDVFVSDAGLTVLVELAGVRKEDLELSFEGGRLGIKGDRPHPFSGDRDSATHLTEEIKCGRFETVIEVPHAYDTAQAKAAYQNGFLRIEVLRRR